jgi:hypothetical protein
MTREQLFYSDSTGTLDAQMLLYFDFSLQDAGRLDMTRDWTHPSSPMGLCLTPANTCTLEQFNARSCNFIVRSEPSGVKPRKVSTPNVQAGNCRWLVGNFSDAKESAYLQIVLSKGSGCPALAGVSPTAYAHQAAPPAAVLRAERW